MKRGTAIILSNTMIAEDTYEMILKTEVTDDADCGQFVQVQVPGYYLRRPISIHRILPDHQLSLIYKVVGDGTRVMSEMAEGEALDLFGPLGHGFPVLEEDVVLIGGGVGVPPLAETAARYRSKGRNVTAVLGFNNAAAVFGTEEFRELGCNVIVATMDGSLGIHGTVIDAIKEAGIHPGTVLACGPLPMLRAVAENYNGYLSLEARMACGIGACMGCVVKTPDGGSLRVCKDGPVFRTGEVVL